MCTHKAGPIHIHMLACTHSQSIEKVSPKALLAAEYLKELFLPVLLSCSNDSGVETEVM